MLRGGCSLTWRISVPEINHRIRGWLKQSSKRMPATAFPEKSQAPASVADVKSTPAVSLEETNQEDADDEFEVFRTGEGLVDYRTVGWIKAGFIMLKVVFALGVLSIPLTFNTFGAIFGSILLVLWTTLNAYCSILYGNFRNNHKRIHTVVDIGYIIYGPIGRELVGVIYIISLIFSSGASILGASISFNAISVHGMCTIGFSGVSLIISAAFASFPKLGQIGVLTWIGCISIVGSVFMVVIAVTQVDRPAAAPQTGDFDLGFTAIAHPGFTAAMGASGTMFFSSGGAYSYLPVMSEMKNARDYKKAVICMMSFVLACYLTFSLVIFAYCGKWVASPSLGSAGHVVKKVAYGIALPGLLITSILVLHMASKYLFVRLLRNTRHLQENTLIHWATWLSCTTGLGLIAFIVASVVPFFNDLNSLIASLFYGPLSLMLPASCWLYDHATKNLRKGVVGKVKVIFHGAIFLLGAFIMTAGTYSSVVQIQTSFRKGNVGSPFSCADNSNSV